MSETRVHVPSETLTFEVSKDGLTILDTTMEMKEMKGNTPAVCDICSVTIGPMKDLKHIESPETISIAVRNGYKPDKVLKESEDCLRATESDQSLIQDIMEKLFISWKEIVDKSETPWALCESCHKAVHACINHKEVV